MTKSGLQLRPSEGYVGTDRNLIKDRAAPQFNTVGFSGEGAQQSASGLVFAGQVLVGGVGVTKLMAAGLPGILAKGKGPAPTKVGEQALTLTRMDELRAKWGNLNVAERRELLVSKAESNAMRRLEEMQNATPGAHFVERHGSQLTLMSQYDRAALGINPTTGAQSYATTATRFFSARDQLYAITRAEQIYANTGSVTLAREPMSFGRVIGEGYEVRTLNYGLQTQVIVRLNPQGKAYTAYPRYGY